MLPIHVAKFGGTSMANAESIQACVDVVERQDNPTLVVVSACAGVTNRLVAISHSHTQTERQRLFDEIVDIHCQAASALPKENAVHHHLSQLHQLLHILVQQAPDALESHQRQKRDELLSFGERCSSRLFAAYWSQTSATNVEVADARSLLVTNSHFGNASPNIDKTREHCADLREQLNQGARVVTQGFIGSSEEGNTTTLGRGGSDYSAAILAAALDAEQLNIWTDVAGIYTTDPRICSEARPLEQISFAEAAELATFGAKVLHPKSLKPAIESGIKVFVGHSRHPEKGGTLILPEPDERPSIRALARRKNQTLLTVNSVDMLHATGFLARLFDILARYDISVDLVTTSEVSIALTLDEEGSQANGLSVLPEAMLEELREFATVTIEQGLSLIAVIGNDIGHFGDISPWVLEAASPVPIRLICQGASRHNLCFLVTDEQAENIIKKLHAKL
ncbi:lysine-sensitive aspartokinase 3 [Idiomarina sp. UBA4519]|jgi:aspartate kinase|uniref:lysine-sensitive aspartokinase 3 n=1 Tax=uncultured Idiomarina sp. TaxID=352961 RepID=UPI000AAB08D5|nr:lysine-sensitive aspartokinase 3 [Idiomarina sp. UBA4519]MBF39570.1 lysine-sensitive aspartokinase 3 [Idiomarinaceae bacterium]|tara:strand:+ start:40019 stop:41374 length:1356 start_codon:yes stop_codon:yes gene_type:complete